jgi:transposase-like protein
VAGRPRLPACGGVERISKMQGKSTRKGLYKCYQCRKPFTVRMGTIFESSKVPLHVWLQAMYLVAGSKKGISSHQLARTLGLTVKTAWFLSHRIREAMREGDLTPFGHDGGAVEVDETYIGRKAGAAVPKGGWGHKMTVLGLVDRNTGKSRFFHVDGGKEIQGIVLENLSREARLMTDEHMMYRKIGREFAEHQAVHHYNKEYVRGDVTTNTIEGAFSHLQARDARRVSALPPRSTCTATLQSLSSATRTVKRTALTIPLALTASCRVSLASA